MNAYNEWTVIDDDDRTKGKCLYYLLFINKSIISAKEALQIKRSLLSSHIHLVGMTMFLQDIIIDIVYWLAFEIPIKYHACAKMLMSFPYIENKRTNILGVCNIWYNNYA